MTLGVKIAIFCAALSSGTCASGLEEGDGKPNIIVEPFVGAWCAKQFPTELSNFSGYDMMHMIPSGHHEKLEPYLGKWCFEQFPDQLSVLDEEEAVKNLYANHKQIEPLLERWGVESMVAVVSDGEDDLIDLEPYVGEWCALQYPQQLPAVSKIAIQEKHVKLEPALARWCFAQFPKELQYLDEAAVIEDLNTRHELVENELIKWSFTTSGVANTNHSSSKKDSSSIRSTGIALLAIALSVCTTALLIMTRHRWWWSSKEDNFEETEPGTETPSSMAIS